MMVISFVVLFCVILFYFILLMRPIYTFGVYTDGTNLNLQILCGEFRTAFTSTVTAM
jgi:hypothetical protein